ncbi:hypothetical protein INR49_026601 [Caranx melampygus]|nr:hypothetical protein INR49_026601 [Caranx melampygus]
MVAVMMAVGGGVRLTSLDSFHSCDGQQQQVLSLRRGMEGNRSLHWAQFHTMNYLQMKGGWALEAAAVVGK